MMLRALRKPEVLEPNDDRRKAVQIRVHCCFSTHIDARGNKGRWQLTIEPRDFRKLIDRTMFRWRDRLWRASDGKFDLCWRTDSSEEPVGCLRVKPKECWLCPGKIDILNDSDVDEVAVSVFWAPKDGRNVPRFGKHAYYTKWTHRNSLRHVVFVLQPQDILVGHGDSILAHEFWHFVKGRLAELGCLAFLPSPETRSKHWEKVLKPEICLQGLRGPRWDDKYTDFYGTVVSWRMCKALRTHWGYIRDWGQDVTTAVNGP
jgi:hypothetical protein